MKEKPKYNQQHCEKHNQRYADYLPECPVCRGEELLKDLKTGKKDWSKLWYTNK